MRWSRSGHRPLTGLIDESANQREIDMLWTILIVLAIIALVLFILGRVRGGRGV